MIITLQDTETREISAKIDELHEERGEAALGRVLTLLISTNEAELEHDLEVANNASREHPCRVIAVAPSSRKISPEEEHPTFLDAEIRFGSDAGAGEIIVLRPRGGPRHCPALPHGKSCSKTRSPHRPDNETPDYNDARMHK